MSRALCSTDRRRNDERRTGKPDRRWFYPALIQDRGKSLPFTRREPDFVPDATTVRRKEDFARKGGPIG
jgi:hypothetical protein